MKKTYGCTIARALLDKPPTREDVCNIRNKFYEDFDCTESSFSVHCFELKRNGWLHYHSTIMAPYITFNKVKYKGWSIKLVMLNTPYQIINWCGYVQKNKVDKCSIKTTIIKIQQFKKDKPLHKKIPCILSFKNLSDSE